MLLVTLNRHCCRTTKTDVIIIMPKVSDFGDVNGENKDASSKGAAPGPDKGFSWVIVGAGFVATMFTTGLFRSSGVLFVAIIEAFDLTRSQASWPFTICVAVMCLIGPLVGFLNHFVPAMIICSVGTLISSIGISLSYFAYDIVTLTTLLGVLQGIGLGTVVVLLPVVMQQYFVRKRGIALGIVLAGANIGSFIFPPVIRILLDEYGLRGTFLLLGGFMLQSVVATCLFWTPIWKMKPKATKNRQNSSEISPLKNDSDNNAEEAAELADSTKHSQERVRNYLNAVYTVSGQRTTVDFDQYSTEGSTVWRPYDLNGEGNSTRWNEDFTIISGQNLIDQDRFSTIFLDPDDPNKVEDVAQKNPKLTTAENNSPFLQLIIDPMFWVICFTYIMYLWVFMSYVMFIVDFAVDHDLPIDKALLVLPTHSLADLIGRLVTGSVADSKRVKAKNLLVCSLICVGIVLYLSPSIYSYGILVVVFMLGITLGGVIILIYGVVAEYLGVEKTALALGFSSFFAGLVTISRPFLVGYFRDVQGSYDGFLYILGAVPVFNALLWLIEPVLKQYQPSKKRLEAKTNLNSANAATTSNRFFK